MKDIEFDITFRVDNEQASILGAVYYLISLNDDDINDELEQQLAYAPTPEAFRQLGFEVYDKLEYLIKILKDYDGNGFPFELFIGAKKWFDEARTEQETHLPTE